MTVLAWLGDAAPLLGSSGPLVIDHPVIPAAVDWLEASLTLTEAPSPSQSRGTAGDVSGWDALAS